MAEPMPPSPRRAGKVVRCAAAAVAVAGAVGCAGLESWDGFSDPTRRQSDGGSSGGSADSASAEGGTTSTIVRGQSTSSSFDDQSSDQVVVNLQAVTSGDLLVVAIGWYDDSVKLSSVTDSLGNTFQAAGDPVIVTGNKASVQVIYYATIATAGATDSITVKLDDRADSPDVRVAEYSGLGSTKPDGITGQSGSSASPSSGPLTIQSAPSLLVAAGLTYKTEFTGAGPDFTVRVISQSGNILEDRIVDHPDSYNAQAVCAEDVWVMQLVAFH
jgi:hypothetical protein